ncbi:MAG: DUF4258 domain-containing protein [Bacteroidia bacterium]
MTLLKKNGDLFRRLRLYAFGFLLGILAVSLLYKGKGCQMPSSAKLEELAYQPLIYTAQDSCKMQCNGITIQEVKTVLKTGKINYDKSNVREKPFGLYAVEGNTADGQNIRIMIADCDTISKIVTAIDLLRIQKDSCNCN